MDSSNSYVIRDETTVIIDPGCYKSFTNLFGLIKNDRMEISDIDLVLNTHLHKDHCESNPIFLKKGALLAFHESEVAHTSYNYRADFRLEIDKFLNTGNLDLEIIHTPGHTPGSVSVWIQEYDAVITGDLIFENGLPGRTDLYGSNTKEILKSLEKIQELEADYILPGHGRIMNGKSGIKALFDKAIHIISNRPED